MANRLQQIMERTPPSEPLTSLDAIVRDWKSRFVTGKEAHRRDGVILFTAASTNLNEAIDRACASRDSRGKMYNHQSKVKEKDRQAFGLIIKGMRLNQIKAKEGLDFDRLHDMLEAQRPPGIGPVTTYDVAVRIAAYMGFEPESLYLHAGVQLGWNALMRTVVGQTQKASVEPRTKRVERKDWPKALQSIPADEVEDLLCCYRTKFNGIVDP